MTEQTTPEPRAQAPGSLLAWLRAPRPTTVRAVMVLVGLQALALAGYTLLGLLRVITGKFEYLPIALALLICTGLAAYLLGWGVKSIGNGVARVKGLVITTQIIGVLVSVSLLQGGIAVLAIGLLIWVGAVLALMFTHTFNGYVGSTGLPFASQD